MGTPFDREKLDLIRQFLYREFRDARHHDFPAVEDSAQVFLIETRGGLEHMLVVPKRTLDSVELPRLLNPALTETLACARDGRVLLTPDGPTIW